MSANHYRFAFLLAGLLLVAAVSQHDPLSKRDPGPEECCCDKGHDSVISGIITEMSKRVVKCYENNDIDCIMWFYADDAIVMAPGYPALQGKESLREYSSWIKDVGTMRREIEEVAPMGPNAEYVFERARVELTSKDGGVMLDGKQLVIWRRVPGGLFEVYILIYNSNQQ